MNTDIDLLALLLRYSRRRMVVSIGLVQAHLVGDPDATREAIDRLERDALLYVDGVTVRLTMAGFAAAVAASARRASVHQIATRAAAEGRPGPIPSRAA